MNIYLNSQQDAMEFVSLVSGFPYEADLKFGICMGDGKSILGVLGMAIRKKATLTIYGEGPQNDICEKLQIYAMALENMVSGIRYQDIPEMKIENESEKGRQK